MPWIAEADRRKAEESAALEDAAPVYRAFSEQQAQQAAPAPSLDLGAHVRSLLSGWAEPNQPTANGSLAAPAPVEPARAESPLAGLSSRLQSLWAPPPAPAPEPLPPTSADAEPVASPTMGSAFRTERPPVGALRTVGSSRQPALTTGPTPPTQASAPSGATPAAALSAAPGVTVAIDRSSPTAFLGSFRPAAEAALAAKGYPTSLAPILAAIPMNEQGWREDAPGNNYYGIKGSNPRTGANTGDVGTWEDYGGGRVNTKATFRAYDSPAESVQDFLDFLEANPRYVGAVKIARETGDPASFIKAVHQAGYATDPAWSQKILSIAATVPAGASAPAPRAPAPAAAAQTTSSPEARVFATPNVGGPRQTTRGIVVHSTRGQGETPEAELQGTLNWFANPKAQVSASAVIAADGTVYTVGNPDLQTWHAGENNADRLGIELVQSARDNERGVPFTEAQYRSLAQLTQQWSQRYGFGIDRTALVGHEELEQGKRSGKTDPGKSFQWDRYIAEARGGAPVPAPVAAPRPAPAPVAPGRPTAGEPGGPPLAAGPVWEPPPATFQAQALSMRPLPQQPELPAEPEYVDPDQGPREALPGSTGAAPYLGPLSTQPEPVTPPPHPAAQPSFAPEDYSSQTIAPPPPAAPPSRPYFAPTDTETAAVRSGIEATQAAEPVGPEWLPEGVRSAAGAGLGALQTVQAASDAVKARIDPRVWGFAKDGIAREILSPAELAHYQQLVGTHNPDGSPKSYADYQRDEAQAQAYADRVEARYQQVKDDPDELTRLAQASPAYAATSAVTDVALAPAVGAAAASAVRSGATALGAGARLARGVGYAADVAGQSLVDPTSLPLQPAADLALTGVRAAGRVAQPVMGAIARGGRAVGEALGPAARTADDIPGTQYLGSGVVPEPRRPMPQGAPEPLQAQVADIQAGRAPDWWAREFGANPKQMAQANRIEAPLERAFQETADAQGLSQLDEAGLKPFATPTTTFPADVIPRPTPMPELRQVIEAGLSRGYGGWYREFADDIARTVAGTGAGASRRAWEAMSLFVSFSAVLDPKTAKKFTLATMLAADSHNAFAGMDTKQIAQAVIGTYKRYSPLDPKTGLPTGLYYMPVHFSNVESIYNAGERAISAPKLSNFWNDFFNGRLPWHTDAHPTNDVHMQRLEGYQSWGDTQTKLGNDVNAYRYGSTVTRRVAAELGVPPEDAQAAGWVVQQLSSLPTNANGFAEARRLNLADPARADLWKAAEPDWKKLALGVRAGTVTPGQALAEMERLRIFDLHNAGSIAAMNADPTIQKLEQAFRAGGLGDLPMPGSRPRGAGQAVAPGLRGGPNYTPPGDRPWMSADIRTRAQNPLNQRMLEQAPSVTVEAQRLPGGPFLRDLGIPNRTVDAGTSTGVAMPTMNAERARTVASHVADTLGRPALVRRQPLPGEAPTHIQVTIDAANAPVLRGAKDQIRAVAEEVGAEVHWNGQQAHIFIDASDPAAVQLALHAVYDGVQSQGVDPSALRVGRSYAERVDPGGPARAGAAGVPAGAGDQALAAPGWRSGADADVGRRLADALGRAPGPATAPGVAPGSQQAGAGVTTRLGGTLRADLFNAAQGGVMGAVSEDLQAQQEGRESDPAERLRRAVGGGVLALAGGRYARPAARAAGSLGSGAVPRPGTGKMRRVPDARYQSGGFWWTPPSRVSKEGQDAARSVITLNADHLAAVRARTQAEARAVRLPHDQEAQQALMDAVHDEERAKESVDAAREYLQMVQTGDMTLGSGVVPSRGPERAVRMAGMGDELIPELERPGRPTDPGSRRPPPSRAMDEALPDIIRQLNEPPPRAPTEGPSLPLEERNPGTVRRIADTLSGLVSSGLNKVQVARVAGMLSDTAGQIANIAGGPLSQGIDIATGPIAAGLDVARVGGMRAVGKQAAREVFFSETGQRLKGMRAGAQIGLGRAVDVLKGGLDAGEAAKLEQRAGFGTNIRGIAPKGSAAANVADFAVEAPLRALGAADAVFKTSAQGGHLMAEAYAAARKAAGGKVPSPEQIRAAAKLPEVLDRVQYLSSRSVLQEDRLLTDWYKRAMNYRSSDPVEQAAADLIKAGVAVEIPFVRTPYNVVAQGMGMSPAGLLGVVQDVKQGKAAREVEQRLARVMLGTGVMAPVAVGVADGRFTGPYPETEKERSLLPPGWRPWSAKIDAPNGEAYYLPLSYAQGLAMPIVMGLLAREAYKKDGWSLEMAGKLAAGVGQYAAQETFLEGFGEMAKLFDSKTSPATWERHAEQLAASYAPFSGLGRELQRVMGMPARDPEGPLEAMLATNPLTAGQVEPRQDVLGREASLGLGGPAGALVRAGEENDAGVLRAFRRAGEGLPMQAPDSLPNPSTGGRLTLSEGQQHRWRRVFGSELRSGWANSGNTDNPERLRAIEAKAREAANQTVLGRR